MDKRKRDKLAGKARQGAEYLLYLFAFASFSIFIAQVGLILSAICWLAYMALAKRREWGRTVLDAGILSLAVITLLSSLAALDIAFHPRGIFKTVGLMLVFYWAHFNLRDSRVVRNSLLAFVYGATLNAVFAVGKYAYNIIRHGDWTRSSGTHSIPQTFSEILVMGYAFLVALYLSHPPLRRRRWLIVPLVAWPLAIFISHTRGAWLGLAVALVLVGSLINIKRTLITAGCVVLLSLGSITAWNLIRPEGGPRDYTDRLLHFFDPSWGSNRTRIMIWQAGGRMLEERPLGIGVDNVYELYPKYRLEGTPAGRFGHLHDNFLQILVERGWLGLLAFVYILVAAYAALLRRFRAE